MEHRRLWNEQIFRKIPVGNFVVFIDARTQTTNKVYTLQLKLKNVVLIKRKTCTSNNKITTIGTISLKMAKSLASFHWQVITPAICFSS